MSRSSASIRLIESTLLGTGSGHLDPVEAGLALRQGFRASCTVEATLIIHSYHTSIVQSLCEAVIRPRSDTILPNPAAVRPTALQHPTEAFLSYAPADEALVHGFEKHLAALKRDGLLATWHEGLVSPGASWNDVTCWWLDRAQLVLPLITADFLASDRCYNVHLARALERHEARQVHIVPILLRPCDWRTTTLAALTPLPENQRPVTAWPDSDIAFAAITTRLRQLLGDLQRTSLGSFERPAVPDGRG
jgi:hypothetical protein